MRSEKLRDLGLTYLAFRNGEDQINQRVVEHFHIDSVQLKKHQCRDRAGPFIAIHEGMILDEMKHVCRGHLKEIGVQILLRKAGSRHGDGRLQQAEISNARASSVSFNLIGMDISDFFKREK